MRNQESSREHPGSVAPAPFSPRETVMLGMDGPVTVVDLDDLPDAPSGIRLEVVVDHRGEPSCLPERGQAVAIGCLVRRDGGWERLNAQGLPATPADLVSHI